MKFNFTLFFLFVLSTLSAQDEKKINLWLNLGTNLSIPSKGTIEEEMNNPYTLSAKFQSRFGYVAEITTIYKLKGNYSLQGGINYFLYNLKTTNTIVILKTNCRLSTTHISTPILARYTFSSQIPLSVALGPYFSYLITAKEIGSSSLVSQESNKIDSDSPDYFENDYSDDFKRFDYGLCFQVDYEPDPMSIAQIHLFMKLNLGLSNTFEDDTIIFLMADKWRNYSLMLGIGFKLKTGSKDPQDFEYDELF